MTQKKTEIVTEGSTNTFVYKSQLSVKGPAGKDSQPFYNPSMEQNRDLSVVVAQWIVDNGNQQVHFVDGLAASGIRGMRFACEVKGDFTVTINDRHEGAYSLIKQNISKNKVSNATASNMDLNVLLSMNAYDYIDIDPFGSPVYFIDSAMRSIRHNGIIACTATDTATLCGVYPKVCLRRYGAVPYHSYAMHEIGLRILLGFLCRAAATYDKGIVPILSYSTDHFFRVYIRIQRGKNYANMSMKHYQTLESKDIVFPHTGGNKCIGPLWQGPLHDKQAIKELRTLLFQKELGTKHELWKLLSLLEEEADAPAFFYTTDDISSHLNISPPKIDTVFTHLQQRGYAAVKTHFHQVGFKTDASAKVIKEVFKKVKA